VCVCVCVCVRVWAPFLGAFVKLRKVYISFVMSVSQSARMEQYVVHWTDFHEI